MSGDDAKAKATDRLMKANTSKKRTDTVSRFPSQRSVPGLIVRRPSIAITPPVSEGGRLVAQRSK